MRLLGLTILAVLALVIAATVGYVLFVREPSVNTDAVRSSVRTYLDKCCADTGGGRYVQVDPVTIAKSDHGWVAAYATGQDAQAATFVLHRQDGVWKVVTYGTSELGCDQPPAVARDLRLDCSTR